MSNAAYQTVSLPESVAMSLSDLPSLASRVAPIRAALKATVGPFAPDEAVDILEPYVRELLLDVFALSGPAAEQSLRQLSHASRETTVGRLVEMAAYCTVLRQIRNSDVREAVR
jgi:hypothetical protein